MLSVGIIGLPNVGKSTLFNALTSSQAEISNYPFTTIESNVGMVAVPDERLEQLTAALNPEKTTPCAVKFFDIAGLIEGASTGEGLGNQFLGEIRQVDAIVHVVRCFQKTDVTHIFETIDPVRDAEVVETELVLADLEVLNRSIAKRDRDWRTHPAKYATEQERMIGYRESLEKGQPLRHIKLPKNEVQALKTAGLLTGKSTLFVANAGEDDSEVVSYLRSSLSNASLVALDIGLELELQQLDPDERAEFMAEMGLERPGLEIVVEAAFELLGLIRFYTVVKNKLQAWEVEAGTSASAAAGKIHSDMEAGFVRAKIVSSNDLIDCGDIHQLQSDGKVRIVGKDYEIEDGDVVEFLFTA